jgi:hypothetical protein
LEPRLELAYSSYSKSSSVLRRLLRLGFIPLGRLY